MADFQIKHGTTLDTIRARLVYGTGKRAYLVGASVHFRMRKVGSGANLIDSPADILDAVNGLVQYQWLPGDTDSVGDYNAEFEVTFPDTKTSVFPSEGYLLIRVNPALD